MAIGSISFVQEPVGTADQVPVITNWNPIVPYVVLQSSISGLFYFKLILEVRLDSSTGLLLGKIKQRRNGLASDITSNKARAIFDLRDMVNSQLEDTNADQNDTTKSIHTLPNVVTGTSFPFSLNYNQVKTIYVKCYQEYSEAATDGPQEYTSPSDNDTRRYIAASLPLENARGTVDFQTFAFSKFKLDDDEARFLSDVQESYNGAYSLKDKRINYVQGTDYHTLGFLNGYKEASVGVLVDEFDSKLRYLHIEYYNAAGVDITPSADKEGILSNAAAYGGCKPAESDAQINLDTERLLYVGCGPANLEAQTYDTDSKPSNSAAWAYYKVYGKDKDGNKVTDSYYFIKQDASCKGYKVRRLAWRNSVGCFDYFNFKMKSTQTLDVSRDEYQTMLGNFNDEMYSYDNFQRGKRVRRTSAVLKETINTDWIYEEDAQLLEGLIMSTNVQIVENADTTYTVPVMITDKSIERKTSANDGVKIQYTFKIEYANPYNTNS